ncbi:MAG: NUDIX domain-containing protein [Candidatus Saccharimonadales bacterium]
MDCAHPGVGVGVIVLNAKGQIMIIRRTGAHAPKYSIPGGALELGETFEACAIRELQEECNITIQQPKVIAVTNNLETYAAEGVHFISVILLADNFTGTPQIMEPSKCSELLWADPKALPQPHFDASRMAVQCYIQNICYYQPRLIN